MIFSRRYFHMYLFAAAVLGFALLVGLNPKSANRGVEVLVEDSLELAEFTEKVMRVAEWRPFADALIAVHVAGLYRPSALLETVSDELERARRRMK